MRPPGRDRPRAGARRSDGASSAGGQATRCPPSACVGITAVLLAYPVWFGLAGPQAVTGVLFVIAPLSGVPLSGVLAPGHYGALANASCGWAATSAASGPPPDFIGGGAARPRVAALVGRRRLLTWLVVFLAASPLARARPVPVRDPLAFTHLWLPWRARNSRSSRRSCPTRSCRSSPSSWPSSSPSASMRSTSLPSRRSSAPRRAPRPPPSQRTGRSPLAATAVVGVAALLPLFLTYDMPFTGHRSTPAVLTPSHPRAPADTVLLTIPFAVSGWTSPCSGRPSTASTSVWPAPR